MNFDKYQTNLKTNFKSSFAWNIFGCSIYESLKILHQICLLKVMHSSAYGLQGSIFSIIYLTVYIAELGLNNSLAPFLNNFLESKRNFKKIFLELCLLPQILIVSCASLIATFFYSKSFFYQIQNPFLFIIPLIILSESIRIFFRRFLHTIFMSKKTVITETILVTLYLSLVWVPYLFMGFKMTQNLVFIPYLIDTVIGVTIFSFYILKFYKTLPNKPLSYSNNLFVRIIKTRFFNYSIQVSKNFFTGNFLTPFFASSFGLGQAGIFNLANHIAESIKAIMKVTVVFSGSALLAKIKDASLSIKRQAFNMLSRSLNIIIYPIIIFLIINYKTLINLKGFYFIPTSTVTQTLVFLFVASLEYFFLAYEQFYIIEERASRLFIFKLFEFGLFYTLIISKSLTSPLITLLSLALIKLVSFTVISTNAYFIWKIRPNFRIKPAYLALYISISLLFYIFF